MGHRPVYRDYIRQLILVILRNPVMSEGKEYTLTDYPFIILLQIPIIAAMIYIYNYSPFSKGAYSDLATHIATGMGILLIVLYWLVFVYLFGFFKVKWAEPETHNGEPAESGFDRWGEAENTPENKKEIWFRRGIFGFLTLVVVGFTLAYCFCGYGMAHIRLYLYHKQALDEMASIAQKYDYFYVETEAAENGDMFIGAVGEEKTIPKLEKQKVRSIVNSLDGYYIRCFLKDGLEGDRLWIMLAPRGYPFSILVWYPKDVSVQEVAKDQNEQIGSVTRLDAHWWHVWSGYKGDY